MRKVFMYFCLLFLSAVSVAAQSAFDKPFISVTGTFDIKVVPDEIVFSMTVNTRNKQLAAAKAENDSRVRKLINLATTYKITPENIQTDSIGISQSYLEPENKPRIFQGYEVVKKVVMVLKDTSKAETLLTDIIESGITSLDDVDFRDSKFREHRIEARAGAMRAAQEKATMMAKEIGQSIGKAYSIFEGVPSNDFTNGVGISANGNRGRSNNFQIGSESSSVSGTIALGQITISVTVTVIFELK